MIPTQGVPVSPRCKQTMPSIIVLDKLSPDGLALLDAAGRLGISYEVKTGLSGEELKNVLASHDGAICRSGVKSLLNCWV